MLMCENCFQSSIYSFKSHQNFEAFEDELQRKCTNKQLTIIDRHNSDFYSAFDTYMYYKCERCDEIWIKSIPDNSWRGFFLPEHQAMEYSEKIRKNNRKKGLGCTVVLVVVVLAAIWILSQ